MLHQTCIKCGKRLRIYKMYHDLQNNRDVWTCQNCFNSDLEKLKGKEK